NLRFRPNRFTILSSDAGWSSLAARRAHNPKVTGSNPVPATRIQMGHLLTATGPFLLVRTFGSRLGSGRCFRVRPPHQGRANASTLGQGQRTSTNAPRANAVASNATRIKNRSALPAKPLFVLGWHCGEGLGIPAITAFRPNHCKTLRLFRRMRGRRVAEERHAGGVDPHGRSWWNACWRRPHVNFEVICVNSISSIPAGEWDALAQGNPLLSHAYLEALESTHCVGPRTGWQPCHLALRRDGAVRAAMPLYEKQHSWGEYVFDQAWANAYARYGMPYYPKLVSAVPFTPVPGPRLLGYDRHDQLAVLGAAKRLMAEQGYSSLHILFPQDEDSRLLRDAGLALRSNVQFHWHNARYRNVDHFLGALS